MKTVLAPMIACVVLALFFVSCNRPIGQDSKSDALSKDSLTVATLKEAYLYGYPLMVMNTSMKVMTNVDKPVNVGRLLAPLNQLVSAQTFPDDKFRDVVRANCDTYYTMGWLNLKDNPMLLSLPDTKGRYYLFPLLDAWTNVFASPGKRTTGTGKQQYLLTSPDWSGDVPSGVEQIKAPTNLIWVIGRVQVNSARDGSTAVKAIQDQITLTALNATAGVPVASQSSGSTPKAPNDLVIGLPVSEYFSQLNTLMSENPPPPADSAILSRLAVLGIGPGASFNPSQFSKPVQDSLVAIPLWARSVMVDSALAGASFSNGWGINRGLGSYGTNYGFRAGIAYGGLGANLDADAVYPASSTDVDGDAYDGSKFNYVLHFEPNAWPPAKAFWSLTMYDSDGFMCANPLNRFAIGDRDKLVKNKDGSLDIFIQRDKPASTTNWLPAPDGPFNLLLRIYWPEEQVITGKWTPPGVRKSATL